MYKILDSHIITLIIITATFLVTPLYIFASYAFSEASKSKGLKIALGFLLFGTVMFCICLTGFTRKLGVFGNLVIPAVWILPSLILLLKKNWFLSEELSQKWLVGLQIFRVIGGVFIIEMFMGNVPGIFAYPAGIGDIVVGVMAFIILIFYNGKRSIPAFAIYSVIIFGVLDFISAFFFGFTSSENPFQLFYPEIKNNVILFPTGLIPLYLVPYAIFYHTLSYLNYIKYGK